MDDEGERQIVLWQSPFVIYTVARRNCGQEQKHTKKKKKKEIHRVGFVLCTSVLVYRATWMECELMSLDDLVAYNVVD